MNREILFRGKRIDDGEWVNGYVLHDEEQNEAYIAECFEDKSAYLRQIIPETVGQYTGLTDKNGKKIFEGDVIKVERDLHCGENKKEREIFNGVVWYDDKHTCFGIKSKNYRCLPIHRFKGDYSTIIGNIHDNPELLKGEQR